MAYILFLALLCIIGIAYLAGKRNVLSPTVILTGVFLVSTLFTILNQKTWNVSLSYITVLVIAGALVCFLAGEILVNYTMERHTLRCAAGGRLDDGEQKSLTPIRVPFIWLAALCVVLLLMFVYTFYKTYEFSLLAGNPGGFSGMLKYARQAQLDGLTADRLNGHIQLLTSVVLDIFMFIFFYQLLHFKWQLYTFFYLVPCVLVLPIQVLSSGRTVFIRDIVIIMMLFCVMYAMKTKWTPRNTVKIIVLACVALLLFFAVFTVAGYLTGKSQTKSAYDMISFYTGMSIPSFDAFLLNPPPDTAYIGNHTLYSMYSVLGSLGFETPDLYPPYEFISFNGVSGNVYTGLRRYIQDYSLLGMFLIMLLLGMLFSAFFYKVKTSKKPNFWLIVYAMFCYPIFEMSIEDRFFMNIVHTNTVYLMLYLVAFYWFFIWLNQRRALQWQKSVQRLSRKTTGGTLA